MQVTIELRLYFVQSHGSNSALSSVVYGGIALSINTEYNTNNVDQGMILFTVRLIFPVIKAGSIIVAISDAHPIF